MDSNTITTTKKHVNYDAKFRQEARNNNNNRQINAVKVVPIIRVELYNEFK